MKVAFFLSALAASASAQLAYNPYNAGVRAPVRSANRNFGARAPVVYGAPAASRVVRRAPIAETVAEVRQAAPRDPMFAGSSGSNLLMMDLLKKKNKKSPFHKNKNLLHSIMSGVEQDLDISQAWFDYSLLAGDDEYKKGVDDADGSPIGKRNRRGGKKLSDTAQEMIMNYGFGRGDEGATKSILWTALQKKSPGFSTKNKLTKIAAWESGLYGGYGAGFGDVSLGSFGNNLLSYSMLDEDQVYKNSKQKMSDSFYFGGW